MSGAHRNPSAAHRKVWQCGVVAGVRELQGCRVTKQTMKRLPALLLLAFATLIAEAAPLVYEGTAGAGKGKQIVFIASDFSFCSGPHIN